MTLCFLTAVWLGTTNWQSSAQIAPACSVAPGGLISWWRAESTLEDQVGSNNAAGVGSLSYGTGEAGGGFWFNGSDAGARIPASASLDVGAGPGRGSASKLGYTAPAAHSNALALAEAELLIQHGDSADLLSQGLRVNARNHLVSTNYSQGSLTITGATGQFKGGIIDPASLKLISVQGVVLQNWNGGCGYFLNTNHGGAVLFAPTGQLTNYPPNWRE